MLFDLQTNIINYEKYFYQYYKQFNIDFYQSQKKIISSFFSPIKFYKTSVITFYPQKQTGNTFLLECLQQYFLNCQENINILFLSSFLKKSTESYKKETNSKLYLSSVNFLDSGIRCTNFNYIFLDIGASDYNKVNKLLPSFLKGNTKILQIVNGMHDMYA